MSSNAWRKAVQLSWQDRWLLLEAFVRLGLVRAAIVAVPCRLVLARVGAPQTETTHEDDPAAVETARRVAWALGAASRRAPWRCKCLEQAIAGKMILRSRGIATTLYLGVARREALEAHAWLRCGSVLVSGDVGVSKFSVVSTFGDAR